MGITPMRYFVEGIAPDQSSQRSHTISRQGDIIKVSLQGRQAREETD